jgi:hypothetical protein
LTNSEAVDVPIADNFAAAMGSGFDMTEAAQRATYHQQHLLDGTFYAATSHIFTATADDALREMETDAVTSIYSHGFSPGGIANFERPSASTTFLAGHFPSDPAQHGPALYYIRTGDDHKDLSRLRLVVFYACWSALTNPDYGNLLAEAKDAGADCAVGWNQGVRGQDVARDWSEKFWTDMAVGATVEEAVLAANEEVIRLWKWKYSDIEETKNWASRGDKYLRIVPARYSSVYF